MRRLSVENRLAKKMAAAMKDYNETNVVPFDTRLFGVELKRKSGRNLDLFPIEQIGPSKYRCHVGKSNDGLSEYLADAIVQVDNRPKKK